MDNARVAALLGVDMVLVCNAGIGSSFDELELNRLLCEKHGVNIKGARSCFCARQLADKW